MGEPNGDARDLWREALEPPPMDQLTILSATARVLRVAALVSLDLDAIERLAAGWVSAPWPEQHGLDGYHYTGDGERLANWTLLLDTLNFCFWGEPGQPRWQVAWRGETLDGYNALAAALTQAMEDGMPLDDAGFLAALDRETLGAILRPVAGRPMIPLFDERLAAAREMGRVLLERYDGRCAQVIAAAQGSAVAMALRLARDFSSFADIADWRGQPVPFLKRAQICVADLHMAFDGQGLGAFSDMEQLTAFADYKLPQLLRRVGALRYAPQLAGWVDTYTPIPAGSEPEVELRAATVWAVELLRRALARRGVERTASAIDYRLWVESQAHPADELPYHRTRTIYY